MFKPVLLISLLLCVFSNTAFTQEEDYEAQLKKLSSTIQKLQKELQSVKTSRSRLEGDLEKSERDAAELNKKIEAIQEALAEGKKQLSQHQRERADLEASRIEQQQGIAEVIRQAYSLGQQSQLKLLLNQDEPYELSRLLRYHDYVVEAQKQKVDAYLKTIQDILSIEEQITAQTDSLTKQETKLNNRRIDLKEAQGKRLNTLAKLTEELKSKDGQLNRLQADRSSLEKLLQEAARALSDLVLPERDSKPFARLKGQLRYPVKGKVAHTYGSPRLGGKLRWQGIFMRSQSGNAVTSIHHGRVIFSDYLRGQGLLIIVDHGDGYMSLYAHNQSLIKETGDWVNSGDVIAKVGNSGGQTQDGLYFEIRRNGKTQNPQAWLKRG